MAIDLICETGSYWVWVSPPHAETWASTRALTATEIIEELSARGCHSTDITDALFAVNPGWPLEHDAEVRRRRDEELDLLLGKPSEDGNDA